MSRELIERLRARKAATAWTIGAHGREHPTHYAPDPDCQDAATALEQQAAEIERLTDELNAMCSNFDNMRLAKNDVRAENEALRKDAERYRWLRTAGAWESEIGMDELSEDPAKFDAAIDAAIDAARGKA